VKNNHWNLLLVNKDLMIEILPPASLYYSPRANESNLYILLEGGVKRTQIQTGFDLGSSHEHGRKRMCSEHVRPCLTFYVDYVIENP
jgi:hypothetical protein